ncbi:MAG: hypothetical protein QM753_15825 [Thermomicrobiales bacterium]
MTGLQSVEEVIELLPDLLKPAPGIVPSVLRGIVDRSQDAIDLEVDVFEGMLDIPIQTLQRAVVRL